MPPIPMMPPVVSSIPRIFPYLIGGGIVILDSGNYWEYSQLIDDPEWLNPLMSDSDESNQLYLLSLGSVMT